MKPADSKQDDSSASAKIDRRIKDLGDWRGAMLGQIRDLIKDTVPGVVEAWKWMGTPVWEHNGIICTGESYKSVVKMTFAKGASLKDPAGLFNSSLDGNVRRAIDIQEGEKLNVRALKALILDAVALNGSKAKKAPAKKSAATNAATKVGARKKTATKKPAAKKSAPQKIAHAASKVRAASPKPVVGFATRDGK